LELFPTAAEAPLSAAAKEHPAASGHDQRLCSSTSGDLAQLDGAWKKEDENHLL